MGNSRLLMIAGMTVICGMYTLGIKRAEQRLQEITIAGAVGVQAKEIARAGIGLGLTRLEHLGGSSAMVEGLSLMGGSLAYNLVKNADSTSASIVSTGVYQGHVVQVSALIDELTPGTWIVEGEHWQFAYGQ